VLEVTMPVGKEMTSKKVPIEVEAKK